MVLFSVASCDGERASLALVVGYLGRLLMVISCCRTVNLVNEIQVRQSENRLTSKGTGVDPSRGVEAMTPKLKYDVRSRVKGSRKRNSECRTLTLGP